VKDIWTSVEYLSSEAKEGGMASFRVSSSFYVAPRDGALLHRHPPSAAPRHTRIPAIGEDPTKQESHGFNCEIETINLQRER
jgi:hypothetical protein